MMMKKLLLLALLAMTIFMSVASAEARKCCGGCNWGSGYNHFGYYSSQGYYDTYARKNCYYSRPDYTFSRSTWYGEPHPPTHWEYYNYPAGYQASQEQQYYGQQQQQWPQYPTNYGRVYYNNSLPPATSYKSSSYKSSVKTSTSNSRVRGYW